MRIDGLVANGGTPLNWQLVAKASAALLVAVLAYIWHSQSALWAEQFGKWAETLQQVDDTVDKQFTQLQDQISKITLTRERQLSRIENKLIGIEGRLNLIEQGMKEKDRRQELRDVEQDRRTEVHISRPWHDSAGEAISNQSSSLQRLQDRVDVVEDETEKRLDIHMNRITDMEQQRNDDHNPYRGLPRGDQ